MTTIIKSHKPNADIKIFSNVDGTMTNTATILASGGLIMPANVQTLTSNITLTSTSNRRQILNPGTANREVTIDGSGIKAGETFEIENIGDYGNLVTVKSSSGITLDTMVTNKITITALVDNPTHGIGLSEIPRMTGNTTPFGTASADGSLSGYAPWMAFSRTNINDTDCWLSANTAHPHWIQYAFPSGMSSKITAYTIHNRNSTNVHAPVSWTLQGSNNGTDWTVVDTVNNNTITGQSATHRHIVDNPGYYRFYRLNITQSTNVNFTSIGIFLPEHEAHWLLRGAKRRVFVDRQNISDQYSSGTSIIIPYDRVNEDYNNIFASDKKIFSPDVKGVYRITHFTWLYTTAASYYFTHIYANIGTRTNSFKCWQTSPNTSYTINLPRFWGYTGTTTVVVNSIDEYFYISAWAMATQGGYQVYHSGNYPGTGSWALVEKISD